MKTIIGMTALCTSIAAILLTGCGAERTAAKPAALDKSFEKTAVIEYFGREYTAKLRRGGEGVWECSFISPDTIAGLTMTSDSEVCRMEFDDIEYLCSRGQYPEYGLLPLLTGSLDALITGEDISCTEHRDHTEEKGETAGQSFTANISGGELRELEIEGCMKAEFT